MKNTKLTPWTRFVGSVTALVLIPFGTMPRVFAADQTWTGTTDQLWSTSTNWTTATPGSGDNVIFPLIIPSGGSTITLGVGSLANALSFKNAYTLSGGDLTLASGGVRVDTGVVARVDSILAGSAGLTKSGGGSLRLTGANAYTGITTINNGSLIIGDAAALGADSSTIIVNGSPTRGTSGGALVLEGGYSSGVTLSRGLSLSGLGPISDRSAALNSVGTNTVSGAVSSSVGTSLPNTRIVSSSGLLTLSGGLDVAGTAATTFTLLGATANGAGAGSYAITGAVTGTGTLEKTGAGTLLLNPSSMSGFGGTLRMSSSASGTQSSVRLTTPIVLGTRTATGTGGVIDMNGGILEVMMDAPSVRSGATPANANVYQRNNSTFYVDHALGSTVTGGTLTLGQWAFEENFNATFNVRNGYNVTIGAAPVQGGTANSTFTNNLAGGTLTFTGAFWSNSDSTGSRTLTIAGNGNTTITGNVTAANGTTGIDHSLTKTGTGTLQITSTGATLDGNLNVNGGTVQITDFRSVNMHSASTTNGRINIGTSGTAGTLTIGTATAATAAGLTLAAAKAINLAGTTGGATINANQAGTNPLIIGGLTATGSGAKSLTLAGSSTSTVENIISAAIPDSSAATSLVKTGPNMWALSGTNTYTGSTTISNGTLRLKANAAGTSTVLGEAAGNTVVFNANTAAGTAGGTLEFIGVSDSATTETLGALTPTAGAATVKLTANSVGASATNLTFTSLGATAGASSVNFVTSGATGGVVTLTGQAATTATDLPGTANFRGHLYINGADFAAIDASANVIAPVYGTTTGFVNAASSLTAANHNLLTGSFTSGAVTGGITSLKMTNQTLTLSGNLTVNLGAILQTGGTGSIVSNSTTARTIVGSAAGVNIGIRVDGASDVLNIGAAGLPVNISSTTTAGLTKNGAGKLVFFGTNAQTGITTINEGSVQLNGSLSRLSATSASLVMRQGTTLEFNGTPDANAVVANLDGAGTITNLNAAALTMTISGSSNAFTGVIQDGTGVINLTKGGTTGTATLTGLNTYTGVTTVAGSTGLIATPNIANIGVASGIGRGNTGANAASLVFSATSTGGLNYTGTVAASTDRLFTLNSGTAGGGGQIANSSATNAPLSFTNTGAIVFGAGATVAQTLTLGGGSTADNVFAPQITDNTSLATAVTKIGAGTWVLTNSSNTYTGVTTVGTGTTAGGVLQAADGAGLSTNSPLLLAAGTTGGGIFQTSGNFTRNIVATPSAGTGTVTLGATTATTAAVGFSASGGKLVVALGGLATPTPLTWGSGGFMGATGTSTGAFVLNNALSTSEVEVRNAINLNGAVRTIQVDDNTSTGADFATITGVVSGSGSLTKSGAGILQLFGANTYTGNTAVTAGTLTVTSLGNSTLAGASSVGDSTVGNTTSGSVNLGNAGTTAGVLEYVGTGETSDRMIRLNTTTATNQIHASGSGALILTNVDNTMTNGVKTLALRGSSTAGNTISGVLTNANTGADALSVLVDGGATWILSGANTHTGNTTVSAGALGLGNDAAAGSGTLVLSNGNIFASGGDRTIANAVTLSNNTTPAFVGDYSITFTGAFNNAASANNTALTNNIVASKSLTLGTVANTAITAARTLTINGSGDTIITGGITTAANFNLSLAYSGTGSLTLGGVSDINGGSMTFSSGTLKVGDNEAIPHGAAANTLITAASSASTTVTVGSTAGLVVGQVFTGGTAGATVVSIDSPTTFTASAAQTLALGAQLLFDPKGGNVTFNPATGVSATFDLNGKSETINGFTATSAGTTIIDNSSASAASLTLGANDQAVSIGGGGGVYQIQNSGAALSLAKTGKGTANIAASLTYTGATTVSNGTLNLNGSIASPTLNVSSTGTLKLLQGVTTPGNLTSVTVAAASGAAFTGGTLSFANGVGTPFNNLTTLNLGAGTGTAYLELDAGDTGTDTLTLLNPNAAVTANAINFLIKDIDLSNLTTYDLLVAPGGGLSGGTYSFSLTGYTGGSLTVSDTLVSLTTGTLITNDIYWAGGTSPATTMWNTIDGSLNTNFSSDLAGTIPETSLPGKGQKIIFAADTITGGAALNTTLEQSFKVNALEFKQSTTPANTPASITIAPGAVSSNSLNVSPSSSANGLNLFANGSPVVTISAPFVAGANQTWTTADSVTLTGGTTIAGTTVTVTDTTGLRPGMTITGSGIPAGATIASITNGTTFELSAAATAGTGQTFYAVQQLNMSGALTGSGNITKAGGGKVILSAASTGYTGTYFANAGITEMTNATALSGVVATPGAGAPVSIGAGGTFYYNNGTSSTVSNNLTLAGGTLSVGGNNQTYSGAVNVSADSNINLRDLSNATLTAAARNITLSGVLSGTSGLTLDSISTLTAGNAETGTLTINNGASIWSGPLTFTRGTVVFTNVAGSGTATPYVGFNGDINFNQLGRVIYRNVDGASLTRSAAINFAAGALAEFSVDNVGALASNYTVTQSGVITLGSGGTGATARFNLADAASNLIVTGGVVLNGNSSISVEGGDADSLVSINTTGISGTGNLAINDEAGAWAITSTRLAINAASTFTGNTTLNEGTLILGHKDALSTGSLTITGASTIQAGADLSGVNAVANALTLNNNLTVSGSNNLTFAGIFTGTGANADRTLTNSLTVGTLVLSGPTINIGATGNTAGRTLTINGTGNTEITGQIVNNTAFANALLKGGTGTLTLSNSTNSYTGATTINAGTLKYGANSAIPSTSAVTVNANAASTTATLDLNGFSGTIGALTLGGASQTASSASVVQTGTGTLTLGGNVATSATGNPTTTPLITGKLDLGAATRTFTVANSTGSTVDLDVQAVISGTGVGITKAGAGVLQLSNVNTYTGATTISPAAAASLGVILATANNALGTGAVTSVFTSGATTGQIQLSGGITLGNSSFTTSGVGSDGTSSGVIRSVSGSNIISGALNMTGGGGASTYRADTGASLTVNGNVGGVGAQINRIINLVGGGNFVFNGNITNTNDATASTVGLDVGNTGTTTLSGNNTYTLATTVQTGGTLIAGSATALSSASAVTLNAGGTLRLNGFSNSVPSITGAGTVENANASAASISVGAGNTTSSLSTLLQDGTGGGTLGLTKIGTGTVTISGTNTFTGKATITNGTLSVATLDPTATANQPLGANAALDLGVAATSSGRLLYTGGATTFGKDINALGNGADTVENGGTGLLTLSGTLTKDGTTLNLNGGSFGISVTGTIVGTSSSSDLVIAGGSVTLSNANTYNGPTILNAGTLNINNANAISNGALSINGGTIDNTSGSAITLASNNPLNINADFTFGGTNSLNLGTGAVTLNANRTVTLNAGTLTIGGSIAGAFNLTGTGAGTLLLTGASTYTGTTNVQGGSTFNVGGNGALGDTSSGTVVGSGSALVLNNVNYTDAEPLNITGTGTGGAGALVGGGTSSFAGPITLGGNATIGSGGGTFSLGGNIDKTGTVLTLAGGGTFNINGSIVGNTGSPNSDLVVDATTVNLNSANTYNGPTYIQNVGVLNANVANALPTANGRTAIIMNNTAGNVLNLGASQSIASLTGGANDAVTLGSNTLTIGAASGATIYGGSISGSGAIVKDLASTLTLDQAASYTGGTTVNGGTLNVRNTSGSATGTGDVTVGASGTLSGTGSIAPDANASIYINGSFVVGDSTAGSPVASTFGLSTSGTGSTVMGAGSSMSFDLFSNAGDNSTIASAADYVNLTGSLDLTAASTLILTNPNNLTTFALGDKWKLFSFTTGSIVGVFTSINDSALNLATGLYGSFTTDAGGGYYVISNVPEPTRALLLMLGLFGIGMRRRRKVA
jgi:autotransporter-associated beta strand protein